jgi:cold shock CspA family protein
LEAVPRSVDPVTRAQRDAWTIHALFFTRLAEARLTRSPADYAQAAGAVTVLGMMASSLPAPLARIVFGRLADKALLLARQCAERAPEEESRTQASRAVETLAPLVTTSLDVRVVCSPRHVKGRVKMIDYARAFGFIVTDNDAPDSYFNVRSMVIPSDFASLSEREAVYFVSRETSRGWRASDVLPVYRVE